MTLTDSNSPVIKVARISAKPGNAQKLREALIDLENHTHTEPGCVVFSFFQALSDENQFILLEHFTNSAALQDHLQQAYTRSFFAAQLAESMAGVDVPHLV
jgi:quinol monooxygenase YgiN